EIADQVFAFLRGRGVVERYDFRYERPEVVFDLALVLRRGRHNLCFGDQAVVANAIAVVNQAPRSLRGVASTGGPRRKWHATLDSLRLVALDNRDGLFVGVDQLDGARGETAEVVPRRPGNVALLGRLLCHWRELIEAKINPRERT